MNNYFKILEHYIFNNYLYNYPIELKDKVKYVLQNGKRLRPILCIIFSGINEEVQGELTEYLTNHEKNEDYNIIKTYF